MGKTEAWLALVTLTSLEIVLGIDNIIFISILVARLPEHQRNRACIQGLALAMITRLLLLFSLAWMMRLTDTLFTVLEQDISWRDVILIAGGMFLLWKSSQEIWESLEGADDKASDELILVGVALIGEGLDMHIPKGYIYFAMGFSFMVEMLNTHMRKKRGVPVHLHKTMPGKPSD